MKAICKITGIPYTIQSFPGCSHLGKVTHPMLSQEIPFHILHDQYLKTWAAGQLPANETHLLGIAFLLRLPIEEGSYIPKLKPEKLQAFWNKNMQALARMADKVQSYKYLSRIPKFRVSEDSFSALPDYLKELDLEIKSHTSPISDLARKRNSELAKGASYAEIMKGIESNDSTEEIIKRGLKGSLLNKKETKAFPQLIAAWAAHTGNFPKALYTMPSGKKEPLADLWKRIIVHAFQPAGKLLDILGENVTAADVEELLDHCFTEIPVGTLQASELFKRLAVLQEILEEFRGSVVQTNVAKVTTNYSDNELLSLFDSYESNEGNDNQTSSAPRASRPKVSESEEPYSATEKLAMRLARIKQGKNS